jgi:hypothetical protein
MFLSAAAICGSAEGVVMASAGGADGDTNGHNVNSKIVIPEKNIFPLSMVPLKTSVHLMCLLLDAGSKRF